MSHHFAQADVVRIPLPDRSVDFVFGSPPYCDARTYGINAQRNAREWVEWMLRVTAEALRVCRGPVVWIAAGVTRDRTYWPACEGLMWEWFKRNAPSGVHQDGIELPGCSGSAYRPCYWRRVGIPGSGGKDWFRADVEYAMCFKHPGELAWSDNTAMGHPPKYAPGGEMSHRLSNGARVNQWGPVGSSRGMGMQRADGTFGRRERPSHQIATRAITRRRIGDGDRSDADYHEPAIANPGNLINTGAAGGGTTGHALAHENEAPFPETLAEWFIKSLCPPGGIVLDPFSGSGTTASAADRLGRAGIGFDVRRSQCDLGKRRCERPHAPVKSRAKNGEAFTLKGLS